jgi:hypothetical protein
MGDRRVGALQLISLKSLPKRRARYLRGPLHDDKSGALQMLHKALRDDLRYNLHRSPRRACGLGSRAPRRGGKVGRLGGREFTGVGRGRNKERGAPEGSAGVSAMRMT